MSSTGLDSLHEVMSRLQQLRSGCDGGNASVADLKFAEEYFSRLLQLEEVLEISVQNYTSYTAQCISIPITTAPTTSNGKSSDSNILCKYCGLDIQARCHDCNDYFCTNCGKQHAEDSQKLFTKHFIEYFPRPIGSPRNSSPPSGIPSSSSNSSSSCTSYSQIVRNSKSSSSPETNFLDVKSIELPLFFKSNDDNIELQPSQHSLFAKSSENYCYLHTQYCNFVCITKRCRRFICTKCVFSDHRGHIYMAIEKFADFCTERIKNSIHHSATGLQKIKGKIDEVLRIQYRFERDCIDLKENLNKVLQQIGSASDKIIDCAQEKIQFHKRETLAILQDQMVHLKAILTAFSEVCTNLQNIIMVHSQASDNYMIIKIYFDSEIRLEHLAENYRTVQPKNWCIFFSPPVPGIDDLGNIFCGEMGNIVWQEMRTKQQESLNFYSFRLRNDFGSVTKQAAQHQSSIAKNRNQMDKDLNSLKSIPLQPSSLLASSSSSSSSKSPCNLLSSIYNKITLPSNSRGGVCSILTPSSQVNTIQPSDLFFSYSQGFSGNSRTGLKEQFVNNCSVRESAKEYPLENDNNSSLPKLLASFGQEGKGIGEICRPWGVCTDMDQNIIISDRRNHRVQVFSSDGAFKYSFGHEGDDDGEFQLPAGICVDLANRIIVVDKDNHRVQIFSIFGRFILKFGKLGKDRGQFQYPWGVAVNSKQQIVVTDSRNHRIQQFDAEGRFIRSMSFEFGITKPSPRGIDYNSDGLLVVSDFDNHCLYLVDLDHRTILRTIGAEGHSLQHFNRPSGISINHDGLAAIADSKNQRILLINKKFKVIWHTKISKFISPQNLGNRDRVSDVAFLSPDRLVFISELSPDEKQLSDPTKTFIHVLKLPELKAI